MNRRSTLLVLLLFLLPLTVPLIPAGPVTLPSETDSTVIPLLTDTPASALASPVLPEGPTKVAGQYEYDGLGAGRSTQEYALGTNTSLAVTSLNYSANNVAGGMRLPAGWTGYRMQANISNLYDQLYWVTGSRENGNYESGGAIATNWTRVSNGMGYPTNASGYLDGYGWNYGYHGYGGLDIGDGGTRGVQAWVEFESGWAWDASKYIAWENTVTIPRDSPTYARLTFRYQADLLQGSSGARGRMVIYVYVAGRTYSQIIPDDEEWHQATVSIPDDDLATWPQHGSILVRLGLSFTSGQVAWDWEYWGFNFDNVQLEVRGKAQPKHTWLQLWMNSTAVSNGGSYGLGTVTISGTWTNPGTTPLRVVAGWWTASSSSVKVDFTYNLTLYIRRTSTTEQQMPPDGSSFWVRNQSSVYWSAWFYAYQPYYFQRYNLTIQRPSETWTLVKATDPQFVDRTSLVETNSTHFRLPYTSFYDYGWWNFNFTSTNRVSSLTLNSKSFQIAPNTPNTLTVTATLGLSTGVANLTLYNASGGVVKQEKKTISSTSVSFTNIVFNTDNGTWFRPGVYTLCVSYANGLTGAMTAAGFKSALITVKHGSASVVPELQTYQVTRIAGTYFYPRVQYYDNDTAPDSTITGATVVGNWTGTNTFNPAGTWYEGRLAADAKVAGNYTLRVNATLAYYGDAYYNIKVVVLEQTALSSPDSPGMTQPYNKQVSVRFYFKKVYDGTPITGATVTSDWPGAGTPTAQGNGWYNFTIDTAQVAKPGAYYMMVTAKKLNHQQQTLTLTIVVRERDTLMTATSPTTVPINGKSQFNVTLSDNDASGAAITNATNKLHLQVWRLGQRYWSVTTVQLAAGKYNVSIDTTSLGAEGTYTFVVNFTWYGSPNNQPFYGNRTATVYVSVRKIVTKLDYTAPDQQPWGNSMNITVTFLVDDPASSQHGSAPAVSTIACTLNGSALTRYVHYDWQSLGGGNYKITIYASRILDVALWQLQVQVTPANSAMYTSASRTLTFRTRAHQTQVVVDPPAKTAFGFNTPMTVHWLDLDKASANVPGNLSNVVVSNCPVGGNQGFGSLSFTLITTSWSVGVYTLTVTITPSLKWYQGGNAQVNVEIRIHYTSVVVQPPVATAWGYNTPLVIQWTDLDTGSAIGIANLKNVTVTNCPIGGSQVFTGTLVPTLATSTWSISVGYLLTVKVYAVTSPSRSYNDVSGTVTVVIRMHRVEVVVPTPAPTPWGSNTGMSVTWRDLDTGSTIAVGNLKNVTVANGPTGTQTFTGSFTFNLITSAWSVGSWSLTVTVYPTTSPQRYEVGSGPVTVTIRAHYVSVTVDPPQAQPKGSNTPLVVHWLDVDTSTDIAQSNLLNVTVKGTAPGLPYMATLLSINLPTSSWSVGSYALTAWVYANSNLYGVASGPVTVTIRAHATRLDVVAPSATPWGHYTHVELKWWDIDVSQYVTGNLKNITVTNCPDLITHTHYSLAFDLDTRTVAAWAVGSYAVTVTLYSSSADYLNAAAPMAVTIRIHYSNVVVQPPSLTPWGTNTPMTVEWRDLDEGNSPISLSGNLINVTVRKSGTSPQSFSSLAFTLLTSSMPPWNIGSHTLNVTVYAVSTGRKYSDQWSTTILTIRGHRVTVVVTPPPAVPYEGSFTLAVQWKDIDTGGAIAISYLNYVRVTGNYSTYPNLPMTRTSLMFPVSTAGWARVDHLLNVTVYPLDTSLFDTQWTAFTVVLRKHNIGAAINPIASIPYSNDTWFTLTVTDADTAGFLSGSIYRLIIVGATTRIYALSNWTTYVKNVSTGVYSVKLLSGTWTLGSYSVQVNVDTVATLNDGTTSTPVTIRQLFTAFTYTPPSQVPWDENGTLIVLYKIADLESRLNGQTLNGSTITVDGLVSPTQYVVTFLGAGVYRISFKASVLGEPGPHPFTARSSAGAQYQGGTLSATMTVRRLLTMLTYSQIPTAPYGDPVIARVQYLVFDGESLAHNGQSISSASITVTGLAGLTLVPGVDYNVAPEGSLYRITITKSLAIASYHIRVNATHSSNRYFEASISDMSFNVRTVYSEIVLEPIAAAAYDENFAIIVIYRVRDDGSSQNGQGIPNADQLTVTTNGSWTLGSWSYVQGSAGYYIFTIDSGLTAYTGRWWVNITLGWAASPPRYDEKWVGGWLVTTERATRVSNTFPANTGYADVVKVYLNYTDIVSGWGIDNATKGKYVRIVVLNSSTGSEITATYWVENVSVGSDWLEPSFFYRISITASELGAVNVIFTFDVSVSWVEGHTPFYTPASTAFSVRIVGTETVLYSDAIDTQPTGDDIVIYLHYNTTGALPVTNGTGLVGIQVGCAEIPSWDHSYWYVPATSWPGTNGLYALIVRGSKNLASGSYTFRINMTWPTGFAPQYAPYYSSAGMIASARVRLIQTTLEWSQPDDVYWSQALVINVWYVDYDHNQNITGVTWAVTGLSLISAVRLSDGTWVITIDTTGQPAGPVSFLLTASKTNYYPQVRDIDVQINLTPLDLQFHDPTGPLREVYWGQWINITVYLENDLTHTPIIGGQVIYQFYTMPSWALMDELGNGYYNVYLDSSPVGATGTQLTAQANMTNYNRPLLLFAVNIKQVDTVLELPSGDVLAPVVIVDDPLVLNVSYWAIHPITHLKWYAITGAGVLAYNGTNLIDILTYIGNGLYRCSLDTSTWHIQPVQILVSAYSANTVQRSITFSVTVAHKPCDILPESVTFDVQYNDTVAFAVFLSDRHTGAPVTGHNIYFVWAGEEFFVVANGTPGWYVGTFQADQPPRARAYDLSVTHEQFEKYGYTTTNLAVSIARRETDIQVVEAWSIATIDDILYRIPVPFGNSTWRIPKNDTLRLVVRFIDYTGVRLSLMMGAGGTLKYFDTVSFTYDLANETWYIDFLLNFEPGERDLILKFTLENYEDQVVTKMLNVINIPMQFEAEEPLDELVYIGSPYTFRLFLNDTYHNGAGVQHAKLDWRISGTLPTGAITWTEDAAHPGYYIVTVSWQVPASGTVTFEASKNLYQSPQLQHYFNLDYHPTTRLLMTVGTIGAVILAIAIAGWALWARVFSIPWEVRRLRSLAKKVERKQGYELSRKDRKHFRAREVKVEDTVGKAMTTVGVPVTAAMLPTTKELVEVSATEEDLMGELDKIPGLGAEEKAVLAQEMRKIPRKDRIWFLDDLRRQMGERRMDFLTTRTPTPAPAPAARAEAAAKPALVEAPKPVTPKPGKPKEKVEKAEKPEKPRERVAPTVRPREEHVAPPPTDALEVEIRRELDKIPGLTADEKTALLEHLRYLTPEERRATYQSLRQTADK